MSKYECKLCNYITKEKSNLNRHYKSLKHLSNVSENTNIKSNTKQKASNIIMDSIWIPYGSHMDHEIKEIKQKVYLCNYCNDSFSGANNLARHKKSCGVKKETEREYEIKFREMQNKIDMLEKSNEHQLEETKYYKNLLNEAGGLVNKSVSALTYVVNNYDGAPAIKTITIQDIDTFDNTEQKIVETVLSHYKHKTLSKYLGDIILKLYKKDDPKSQSIWNTDDNRLTYLIKELLNNKSSNWIVDKKGIKTQIYLIDPLLAHIKSLLVSYQTNYIIPDANIGSVEVEFILENSKKIIELVNDIDDGIISKEILKHISSHLKFNGKAIE